MQPFLEGYLPYLLQRADQLLSARFHRAHRSAGVTSSEWRVLAVLAEHGPLTVSALTRRALLPQPTTTHAVARLEEAGDVVRRATGRDARQRIVTLTAAGRRRAAALIELAAAELDATLADAGIDVPAEFAEQLIAISDALEAAEIERRR